MKQLGSPQILLAYKFLKQAEADARPFSFAEFISACGYSKSTGKATLAKKLARLVRKRKDALYEARDIGQMTEEAFCRLCSQSAKLSTDPLRPLLEPTVEGLVIKAREAALAAVQHYNNPTAVFRSGNFIVLMMIAYTSLFHAIFERDNVNYVFRKTDGSPRTASGEEKLWDVGVCLAEYIKRRDATGDAKFFRALNANIGMFLPLRHKIEHRTMPQLDDQTAGHCQSMLMNFERVLVAEFTDYYALAHSLTLALQFTTKRPKETTDALRLAHAAEYDEIKEYINKYHASLPDEIMTDPSFALRVWLVPKLAKHARESDLALEYVHFDPNDPEQAALLEQLSVVAIKNVVRETQDRDTLLPAQVSAQVEAAIGRKFRASSQHSKACKYHKIQPPRDAPDETATNPDYCVYNPTFKRYVYKKAWVAFLIKTYSDKTAYDKVFGKKSSGEDAQKSRTDSL